MDPHPQYVSYYWLFGSVVAILAILVPSFIAGWKLKVNKEACAIKHNNLDEKVEKISTTIEKNAEILSRLNEVVIRIETVVTKNFS